MDSSIIVKLSLNIETDVISTCTVDKDPNGQSFGTPPYKYGSSNPPLTMATLYALVRPNSYGLIVATLTGSLLLS